MQRRDVVEWFGFLAAHEGQRLLHERPERGCADRAALRLFTSRRFARGVRLRLDGGIVGAAHERAPAHERDARRLGFVERAAEKFPPAFRVGSDERGEQARPRDVRDRAAAHLDGEDLALAIEHEGGLGERFYANRVAAAGHEAERGKREFARRKPIGVVHTLAPCACASHEWRQRTRAAQKLGVIAPPVPGEQVWPVGIGVVGIDVWSHASDSSAAVGVSVSASGWAASSTSRDSQTLTALVRGQALPRLYVCDARRIASAPSCSFV